MKEVAPERGGCLPFPAQMPYFLHLPFTPLVFKVFHRPVDPEASLPSFSSFSQSQGNQHSFCWPGCSVGKSKLHLLCLVSHVPFPQLKSLVIYIKSLVESPLRSPIMPCLLKCYQRFVEYLLRAALTFSQLLSQKLCKVFLSFRKVR